MSLLSNLVAYWKLDESSGNPADSQSFNTLTNNNTILFAAGKINNAADLEAGNNQYFSITDVSQVGLDVGTAFSASFWVKVESDPANNTDYSILGKWGQNQHGYLIQYSDVGGTKKVRVFTSSTTTGVTEANANVTLTSGTFFHVAVTYNGTNSVKIYVNGTDVTTANTSAASIFDNTAAFELGAHVNDSGSQVSNYDGLLDEVGVWTRVLSAGEIAVLYNNGNGLSFANFAQSPSLSPSSSSSVSRSPSSSSSASLSPSSSTSPSSSSSASRSPSASLSPSASASASASLSPSSSASASSSPSSSTSASLSPSFSVSLSPSPIWDLQDMHVVAFSKQTKNSSSYTRQSLHSASWTKQHRNMP
jgi:hypothetical protein